MLGFDKCAKASPPRPVDTAPTMASHAVSEVDLMKTARIPWLPPATLDKGARPLGRIAALGVLLGALVGALVGVTGCSSPSSNGPGGATSSAGSGAGGAGGAGGAMQMASASSGVDLFDGGLDDGAPADGSKPPVPNLVSNGDFSAGNTQFLSDYAYADFNTLEGEYTVGTNPQAFNGNLLVIGDHTSGDGLMFIGNGKATPDRVWYSGPITVDPGTKYYFEAWVMNACCPPPYGDGINPVGPSELSFYANDVLLGTRTSSKLGVWEGLSTTWDSGAATSVTLKLVNANTEPSGNDFGVDDVFLGIESTVNPPN